MAAILAAWKSVCDMPISYQINRCAWPSGWMEINLNAPDWFPRDKVPTLWNGSIPEPTKPSCHTSALLPSRRCGDPWCHATALWGTPVARRTCERWSAWRAVPEKLLQPGDSSPAQTQTKKICCWSTMIKTGGRINRNKIQSNVRAPFDSIQIDRICFPCKNRISSAGFSLRVIHGDTCLLSALLRKEKHR